MPPTLTQELAYVLSAAMHGLPRARDLERHLVQRGGRVLPRESTPVMGMPDEPTKLELAGSPVRLVWLSPDATWGGCGVHLFVSGTVADVEAVVGPLAPIAGTNTAVGRAWIAERPIQVRVTLREHQVWMIELGFDRVQGRFVEATQPLIPVEQELLRVLQLAEYPPVTADAVEALLAPRGPAVVAGPNLAMPWWAESCGGADHRFVELPGSAVSGIAFVDDPRGWGCDVDLYATQGSLDAIARAIGQELRESPAACDDFRGRDTTGAIFMCGALEVRVSVEHVGGHVAKVHLHFPARLGISEHRKPPPADEANTPPRGVPIAAPAPSGRRDVAVIAVHDRDHGRVARHEVAGSFTVGNAPTCDIVLGWHNRSMPNQVIFLRVAELRIVENTMFSLDGWPIDLAFPHQLQVGSRLTLGARYELVVEQLPE